MIYEEEIITLLEHSKIRNDMKWIQYTQNDSEELYNMYKRLCIIDRKISSYRDVISGLYIVSALQLYQYYKNTNKIQYRFECILACYLMTRTIYSEMNFLHKKRLNRLYEEYEININKIYFYEKDMWKFFEYDFHRIPLTINYFFNISFYREEQIQQHIESSIYDLIRYDRTMIKKSPFLFTCVLCKHIFFSI